MLQVGTAAPVASTEAAGMWHAEFPTNTLHPVFSAGQSTSNPTGSQLSEWELKQIREKPLLEISWKLSRVSKDCHHWESPKWSMGTLTPWCVEQDSTSPSLCSLQQGGKMHQRASGEIRLFQCSSLHFDRFMQMLWVGPWPGTSKPTILPQLTSQYHYPDLHTDYTQVS